MTDVYGPDLAAVHDARFGFIARAGVRTLLERLPVAGVVADLGCGSGIAAAALAAAGHDVVAVDPSPAMLALARARVPRARFTEATLAEAELPPGLTGACAFGEVVNYGAGSLGELSRVSAALAPGGVLVLDVASPGREPAGTRNARLDGDGWILWLEAVEEGDVLRRRIVLDRDGERSAEEHVLRLYTRDDVLHALDAAGLEPEVLPGYDGLELPPGLVAYAAARPA
jgi:SAM-dependent methyltransferase